MPGPATPGLLATTPTVALAICYELSVPAHAEDAFAAGADVYVASVAKTQDGIAKGMSRLSEIARQYSAPTLLANCLGLADGMLCVGNSAAWRNDGSLACQLDDQNEGMILFDTQSQEACAVAMT